MTRLGRRGGAGGVPGGASGGRSGKSAPGRVPRAGPVLARVGRCPMPELPDASTSRERSAPVWPRFDYLDAKDTLDALRLWTQIVGKVRVALTPWLNHGWHSTLYVSCRGLTTSPIPHGGRFFQLDLDFLDHVLRIADDDGAERTLPLAPGTVAGFHAGVLDTLAAMGLPVRIHGVPNEIPDAIAFRDDHRARPYDAEAATRLWRVLQQVDRVLHRFRTGFLGKASPVHFFWGSFDLAVTRFSGRPAPPHPGGIPGLPDAITREAYSHEVSSAGFWPGGGGVEHPAFYSYAYPVPEGFGRAAVEPAEAGFHEGLGEFVLPYEAVRTAGDPDATLLSFLQSTYEAAAEAGGWDRAGLECEIGRPGVPRALP